MNFSKDRPTDTYSQEILIDHNPMSSEASLNWELVNQSISKNANLGSIGSSKRETLKTPIIILGSPTTLFQRRAARKVISTRVLNSGLS
jgi:hypothetical protein